MSVCAVLICSPGSPRLFYGKTNSGGGGGGGGGGGSHAHLSSRRGGRGRKRQKSAQILARGFCHPKSLEKNLYFLGVKVSSSSLTPLKNSPPPLQNSVSGDFGFPKLTRIFWHPKEIFLWQLSMWGNV